MVYYRSHPTGEVKQCWITTWTDWAMAADIGDSPSDPLPVPEVVSVVRQRRVRGE